MCTLHYDRYDAFTHNVVYSVSPVMQFVETLGKNRIKNGMMSSVY